jgi:hypothetical protein
MASVILQILLSLSRLQEGRETGGCQFAVPDEQSALRWEKCACSLLLHITFGDRYPLVAVITSGGLFISAKHLLVWANRCGAGNDGAGCPPTHKTTISAAVRQLSHSGSINRA